LPGDATPENARIPPRNFGKTGVKISALGLSGHHLGAAKNEAAAVDIVRRAVDGGIAFYDFKPLSAEQIDRLRASGKEVEDGRYELFKTTVKYDGDVGRQQHNFPTPEELPA
jgi:hypothetical protein